MNKYIFFELRQCYFVIDLFGFISGFLLFKTGAFGALSEKGL